MLAFLWFQSWGTAMPFGTSYQFVNLDDNDTLPIKHPLLDFGAASGAADVIGLKNGGLAGIGDSSNFVFSGTIFDATGGSAAPMGDNNAGTNGSIAQLSNRNLVVVSESSGFLIYKIFNSATGDTVVDSTGFGPGSTTNADVTELAGGGFAIASQRNISGSDNNIILTIGNNNGDLSPEIVIDTTSANDASPSIAQLDGGNIVVAWTRTVGTQTEIWYSIRDAAGGSVKAATLFDTQSAVNRDVSITALDGGRFAFAYEDKEFATAIPTSRSPPSMPTAATAPSSMSATAFRIPTPRSSGSRTACWRWPTPKT